MPDLKQEIADALADFQRGPLRENAVSLLNTLGYRSTKTLDLDNRPEDFLEAFDKRDRELRQDKALFDHWKSIDFLFQITDEEVRKADIQTTMEFDSSAIVDERNYQSYLFFLIELEKGQVTRTNLADLTREVNLLFEMPVMLMIWQDGRLSLTVIDRRLHRRDPSRDVLQKKVTMIRDIRVADPLRAHVEILFDFALESLQRAYRFHDFVGLHQAWEKQLDTYELNNEFYRDIVKWYFWTLQHPGTVFPRSIRAITGDDERGKQESIFVIRLLTRLIFCWFLQEKGLIPREVFRRDRINEVLTDLDPDSGSFYKAILQNLFFATLNQEMGKRTFRRKYSGSRDGNRGITNLYR